MEICPDSAVYSDRVQLTTSLTRPQRYGYLHRIGRASTSCGRASTSRGWAPGKRSQYPQAITLSADSYVEGAAPQRAPPPPTHAIHHQRQSGRRLKIHIPPLCSKRKAAPSREASAAGSLRQPCVLSSPSDLEQPPLVWAISSSLGSPSADPLMALRSLVTCTGRRIGVQWSL